MTLAAPRALYAPAPPDPQASAPAFWHSLPGAARLAVGLITLAAFVLRLAAARGDLWLDELWSLDLVSRITSPDQVFWNIPHDNNHMLNSLWMFVVGQSATPVVYRLPAVVMGTATVLVASQIGARVNMTAAVAAAALTACSYPLVDYGSEARGYAGLILAILLAIDISMAAADRMVSGLVLDDHGHPRLRATEIAAARRLRWPLAGIILFGTCSHVTMLAEAAVLTVAMTARLKAIGLPLRTALDETVAMFRPSLLLLLPLLAAFGTGVGLHHGFTLGGLVPFSPARYLHGYGGLLQVLLGLPPAAPPWSALVVAGVLVGLSFRAGLIGERWRALAGVAFVVWPALVFLARVPNTEFARYFLSAGLVLPIMLAEIAGRLWMQGRMGRFMAFAGVLAICAGQEPDLTDLLIDHRGAPAAAVAVMATSGPASFVALSPWSTDPVVDAYATKLGANLQPVAAPAACRLGATWLIAETDHGEPAREQEQVDTPGCTARFTQAARFPAALWSGRTWTLYRRAP